MIKLPDKTTIYFDCDDTLVMHNMPDDIQETKGKEFRIHNHRFWLVPHEVHIQMLKNCKANGQVVVVWTQGGADWAEVVVDTLGLRDHVDLCVSKPFFFVDDLVASAFMPNSCRIYQHYARSTDPSN